VIQLAAGLHLAAEGGARMHGAARNLGDALEKLLPLAPSFEGVDVARLVTQAEAARSEADEVARGARAAFDRTRFFALGPLVGG
jgi:hypothetical protein